MHPNIPAEIMLRHLAEQAARDRRASAPRRPTRYGAGFARTNSSR